MNIQSISHSTPQLDPLNQPVIKQAEQTVKAMFNPAQSMADSMEEVSMKFSESVEKNSKSLEERTIKPRSEQRIEKLAELYELLTNHDTQTLNQEARRILSQGQQQLSIALLLDTAKGDPAKAEVILQKALAEARTTGQANKVQQLELLGQELYAKHGAEVMAGLNTAGALAMFSQDPEHRQTLRQLYYQHIVGQGSLATLFDALLTQFDEAHFAQGLHTLIRALTDDLAAQFPSLPQGQLRVILKDLTASQQLSHILNSVQVMLRKLAAKGMIQSMSAAKLTRKLVEFTQSSLYPREVKNLNTETVGDDPLAHVVFLNALYPLVQKLPLPLWKDNKARQNTLNVILRLMTEYAHYERQQESQATRSTPRS